MEDTSTIDTIIERLRFLKFIHRRKKYVATISNENKLLGMISFICRETIHNFKIQCNYILKKYQNPEDCTADTRYRMQ